MANLVYFISFTLCSAKKLSVCLQIACLLKWYTLYRLNDLTQVYSVENAQLALFILNKKNIHTFFNSCKSIISFSKNFSLSMHKHTLEINDTAIQYKKAKSMKNSAGPMQVG